MFGKKKESGVAVQHYEGIDQFASDSPVRIEIKNDVFEIKRLKPETVVTLPMNRIKSFSCMKEENYMLKYHGEAKNTSKAKGIDKFYLDVIYDKGHLGFWGTASAARYFTDLQYMNLGSVPSTIEL